ncbi:MAG: CRISPR-associated ring nuclease Csm6 [Syntrophales bacterium]|nr:CRISPR-associated ring nuclease Csm6 [Syntrophales bacterium]
MKTILLAVVGLSPQVITETLYALHQQQRGVDVIHVITTRRGREAIETHLLSPKAGKYFRYFEEYGITPGAIDFGHQNIHTVSNEEGIEIDDIENEDDNERFLRKCLELTFRFTGDDQTSVFFSIAGGRKTMSACLMTAAQFYARPQDRVYHVLVSPEFENSENFFYPPLIPGPVELRDRQGRRIIRKSDHSQITLLHVPFITIRDQLAPGLLQAPADPESLLFTLIRDDQYGLTVDLTAGKLIYKNQAFAMMPARLALYAFFVMQKKNCPKDAISPKNHPFAHMKETPVAQASPPPAKSDKIAATTSPRLQRCRNCTDCYLDFAGISARQDEITNHYRHIGRSRDVCDLSDSGIIGLTAENFNAYKGKIRRDLANAFGLYTAGALTIEGRGRKPDTRYGIRMDKDRIRLIL